MKLSVLLSSILFFYTCSGNFSIHSDRLISLDYAENKISTAIFIKIAEKYSRTAFYVEFRLGPSGNCRREIHFEKDKVNRCVFGILNSNFTSISETDLTAKLLQLVDVSCGLSKQYFMKNNSFEGEINTCNAKF